MATTATGYLKGISKDATQRAIRRVARAYCGIIFVVISAYATRSVEEKLLQSLARISFLVALELN